MPFKAPDFVSVFVFVMILLWVLALFLIGIYRANQKLYLPAGRRVLMVGGRTFIWLGLVSVISGSGYLEKHSLIALPLFMAATLAVTALTAFSNIGTRLVLTTPMDALVAFQIFRLPLEMVLHSWGVQGAIPMTMTWNGQNFDFISGIVAILSFPMVKKYPRLAWVPNIVGIVLLLNVIRVVIMSSPLPFAWQVTPPLQLAYYFPYVLILPVCVGGALFDHILITRALLRKDQ